MTTVPSSTELQEPHLSVGVVSGADLLSGFPDLEVLSAITLSRQGGVFRCISKKYGKCIVKTTSATPTQVAVEQLRKEYHKLRLCQKDQTTSLTNHHLVQVHDIYEQPFGKGAGAPIALVIQECGISLKSWSRHQYGRSLPTLKQVLEIGMQIAQGLDWLHRHARLIHSDMTPSNVCYDETQHNALIIDLGAAHGFSEPFTAFTPAYQSPEQARGLSDHRSDLYSLGILLFQLYTGRLPIQRKTRTDYRIAHMLHPPLVASAVRRECPIMLERILAKLLRKSPDERYLTAAGLLHDLKLLSEDPTRGFELGTREVPFIFPLPNELIGRSREFEQLDQLYEACALDPDMSGFCSLQGKPGVGKTTLIQTFALQQHTPFFISFKFNQYGNTPMKAIVKIMSRLVHQTVTSEHFSDHSVRQAFLERLRDCDVLRALVDLVPAYAKLIPKTEPIPEGIMGNVHLILYPAIAHVLKETRKFCRAPIVLFFDDVQWIDPGTKGVLSYLLAKHVPILLMVAYRDRTSQSTFAIESLLSKDDRKSRDMPTLDCSLRELCRKDVHHFIHSLALSEEDKKTLNDTMYDQTEGNPFFLRFHLSQMAETGALVYDVDTQLWKLDKDRVDLTTAITAEDAVEYCVAALRTLDREVSSVLCRLAMMPQGLTLDAYASILENEQGVMALAESRSCTVADVIHNAVTIGVQKHLLYRSGRGFKFAHDRLQQSAMQFVDEKESSVIHYYLGQHSLGAADATTEDAFLVLEHFSKSREYVQDSDLILRIGSLTADICAFYVTSGSHEQLDGMLHFARDMLDRVEENKRSVEPFSSLHVRLLISHHQIKFLMNDIEMAESLFDEARPRLQSAAEIRDAYHTRLSLLINTNLHKEAIETTAEALARLGSHSLPEGLVLPVGQPAGIVADVTRQIKAIYAANPDWDTRQVANSLTLSTDEDHNFRVEIMISVIAAMYLTGRFDLYLYVPAVCCQKILAHGATRSCGHAFSVLGFGLVAVFGDTFGAEVAMLGKYLVDRFDNQVATCRAYALTGIAIVYDERYDGLATRILYASYVAGRSAHDILWACYAICLLSTMLLFDGIGLSEIMSSLEDPVVYAMNSGHQAIAQRTARITMHIASLLRGKKSKEEPIFHYSIPSDDTTKSQPLIGFTHGTVALIGLYFDQKLEIAWQIITDIVSNGLEKSAPGVPVSYTFHVYTAVICHGLLLNSGPSEDIKDERHQLSEEERGKLKERMKASTAELERLSGMARSFRPLACIAQTCVLDAIENQPLRALQVLESFVGFVHAEKPGKHYDLVAISQMLSSDICERAKLGSMQSMYMAKAIGTLNEWGANNVVRRLSKEATYESAGSIDHGPTLHTGHQNSINAKVHGSIGGGRSTPSPDRVTETSALRSHVPDFASVLASASYITSFSTFDELTTRLCSTLLKQATATRLLLFIRNPQTGELEPTAESTNKSDSSPSEALVDIEYSVPILKVTEELQERVIVHSAQKESPHCFESYIQSSGVCSVASIPISYQNALVAIVYMEHDFREGVFRDDIMEHMTLLGQHVASAVVNALLLRDVRKRTVQLEQSHAVLAKALKVKDSILSNTSHELRSPLNGIIGLNEFILSSEKDLEPEVKQCMRTTLAAAKQLLHLVSDILDMSRIEEGALKLNYETASLYTVVKEVCDVASFTSDSVRLINFIDPNFPEIIVDPARLKQVIFNLTSNAIKFTPEGSVTISSEFFEQEKMFLVAVSDTGIGIDKLHMDLIFEPFGQVEAYETKQHEGAGLGLSITKQLVEIHGGRIDVYSTVGEGTTFQVFIPAQPPSVSSEDGSDNNGSTFRNMHVAAPLSSSGSSYSNLASTQPSVALKQKDLQVSSGMPEEAPRRSSSSPKGSRHNGSADSSAPSTETQRQEIDESAMVMSHSGPSPSEEPKKDSVYEEPIRVLAVDDIPLNLKVLSNFLRKAGMEVATTTNGQQLLSMLSGNKWVGFDVVLLDWMMPVMDGLTACRLLRQRIPSDLLPVMFITAKSDPADLSRGFEAGGNDFAVKPFNRHEMVARTAFLGRAARRARMRYYDSVPVASLILTKEPFWKVQSTTGTRPMFVICLYAESRTHHYCPSCVDGPTLLRFFRSEQVTSQSDWQFFSFDELSTTFLAVRTSGDQIRQYLRIILAGWATSQMAKTTSRDDKKHMKPLITVGVDYRPVCAHLFAERQPMMAAVESPVALARTLAQQGTKHEEILLSDSAQVSLAEYCIE